MSTLTLDVVRRPQRRTHLALDGKLMCRTRTALDNAHITPLHLNGVTTKLRNDLGRELDGNTCIPCTMIARGMLALYVTRDTGRPW